MTMIMEKEVKPLALDFKLTFLYPSRGALVGEVGSLVTAKDHVTVKTNRPIPNSRDSDLFLETAVTVLV